MTTKSKTEKGAKGKTPPTIPEAIKQASGELYDREMLAAGDEAARFIAAAKGEGTAEEIVSAWADFSALVARTMRCGRLWTPERVTLLSLALLAADAEARELERVVAAFDAAGESKRLAKFITSPVANVAPLPVVDRLAVALEVTKAEARMAAGYLDETAQPSAEGGAGD